MNRWINGLTMWCPLAAPVRWRLTLVYAADEGNWYPYTGTGRYTLYVVTAMTYFQDRSSTTFLCSAPAHQHHHTQARQHPIISLHLLFASFFSSQRAALAFYIHVSINDYLKMMFIQAHHLSRWKGALLCCSLRFIFVEHLCHFSGFFVHLF